MKDDLFEQNIREILCEEQEVPIYLTSAYLRKPRSSMNIYIKWLFVFSCILLVIEEVILYHLYFISASLFMIAVVQLITVIVIAPTLAYLFKSDIAHFLTNQRRMIE